jgi:ABC-type lipoprotein release transport system permease subunit
VRDPLTFAIVPLVLLAVATVAAIVPARRAAAIDPMDALRED